MQTIHDAKIPNSAGKALLYTLKKASGIHPEAFAYDFVEAINRIDYGNL